MLFLERLKETLYSLSSLHLILKGGTALLFAYGLDRLSVDLDFDAPYPVSIDSIVKKLKTLKDVNTVYVKKDTETVKRLTVHPKDRQAEKPIKIDISLRGKDLTQIKSIPLVGEIEVYRIEELLRQKLKALQSRSVARDIYDVAFILDRYENQIPHSVKERAYSILSKLSESNFEDFLVIYGDLFASDEVFHIFQKKGKDMSYLAFMRTMGRLERFLSDFEADSSPEVEETEEEKPRENIPPPPSP